MARKVHSSGGLGASSPRNVSIKQLPWSLNLVDRSDIEIWLSTVETSVKVIWQ